MEALLFHVLEENAKVLMITCGMTCVDACYFTCFCFEFFYSLTNCVIAENFKISGT